MSHEHRLEVVIPNRLGLHLRAAKKFAQMAQSFQSEVWVEYASLSVNGKSILELTTLAAGKGSRVRITTRGGDGQLACQALHDLISGGFGEE